MLVSVTIRTVLHNEFCIYTVADVEKDSSQNMADTIEHIKELIGEPRNYGKTSHGILKHVPHFFFKS